MGPVYVFMPFQLSNLLRVSLDIAYIRMWHWLTYQRHALLQLGFGHSLTEDRRSTFPISRQVFTKEAGQPHKLNRSKGVLRVILFVLPPMLAQPSPLSYRWGQQ